VRGTTRSCRLRSAMKSMARRDELVGHYTVRSPVKGSRAGLQQLRIASDSLEGVTIGYPSDSLNEKGWARGGPAFRRPVPHWVHFGMSGENLP
jgi:hypothetical protein